MEDKEAKMKRLSVIVPIYNVEKYIRPCLESIFRQGLDEDNYEIILINDGTKDRSMDVIQDIIACHSNITVIEQENQGLSVVRNKGIAWATGEYIIMPDSDDLLIDNSLPKLLEIALSTKADLVVANFLEMNDEEIERTKKHPPRQVQFEYQEKTGEQLFIKDLNPYQCYVWRTLFKRDFLVNNNLKFVRGVYYQDIPFTHECYLKAKKCITTTWLLNIYRRGHESATSSFTIKNAKDFCIVIAETWKLTRLENLSSKAQKKLREDIFTSFSALICSTAHEINKASDRIDIIDFLRLHAPDIYFKNGTKQEVVSLMFKIFPHSYIHIRYLYAKLIEDIIFPFYYHRLRRPFLE